jgi:hypothetical protein
MAKYKSSNKKVKAEKGKFPVKSGCLIARAIFLQKSIDKTRVLTHDHISRFYRHMERGRKNLKSSKKF